MRLKTRVEALERAAPGPSDPLPRLRRAAMDELMRDPAAREVAKRANALRWEDGVARREDIEAAVPGARELGERLDRLVAERLAASPR